MFSASKKGITGMGRKTVFGVFLFSSPALKILITFQLHPFQTNTSTNQHFFVSNELSLWVRKIKHDKRGFCDDRPSQWELEWHFLSSNLHANANAVASTRKITDQGLLQILGFTLCVAIYYLKVLNDVKSYYPDCWDYNQVKNENSGRDHIISQSGSPRISFQYGKKEGMEI